MLQKSLQLFPLPGVEALLTHAKEKLRSSNETNGSSDTTSRNGGNNGSARAATGDESSQGTNGRAYSAEQVRIVKNVLAAKEGGRGAHYRVLNINESATEADIKKAYRKLSLKVHPDKVSIDDNLSAVTRI
jgi:hypothetical protein